MIIKLTNGETVFEIANGVDRLARVARDWRPALHQETQEVVRARAESPTAFPDRAVRWAQFPVPVIFPPCDTLEESLLQSMMIPAQCPRGGVLTVYHAGNEVTYSQAWIVGEIGCEGIGLTNLFTFNLKAVNPTAVSYVLDELGEILEDEEGGDLEY